MITRRVFQGALAGFTAAGAWTHVARAEDTATTAVDAHAHVFRRGLPLAANIRYAPDYDATPEDYLKTLEANGISNAVLVQPSFLGTDNSYLLDALKRYPDRFRGIAVVQPDISPDTLREFASEGIVGVRLNLIGAQNPQFDTGPWPMFLKRLSDLGWQVEIQAEARRWPELLPLLLESGVTIVADHFGKPDPKLDVDDPGFRELLKAGASGRVWVKISGSYRNGAGLPEAAMPLLRDSFGLDHLVWGSDWPHTQFEKATNYTTVRRELDVWLPEASDRKIVLIDAPRKLFWSRGR
ncbi:4-sulfomuconolactone hydrolase [Methylobacterium tardum]|uniref:Hydrolase n=1 Tax=Methylobacterium tardum TaxID=374432 RepID=A0AA37WUQ3_9HYPH|nr:amidohydrolase family protein [Methylobacterium tardum]URD35147.1 amidohydrolase family protein [Methylobacterium tardum]GJE52442.1 4-sulfomuconolactone hydrolase [Methylobacterium tardum]GLS73841.1 hydrolase [Methylobacterium tardum]